MKISRITTIIIGLLLMAPSCRNRTAFQTELIIINSSDIAYEIVLFPKPEFQSVTTYRFMDNGAGYSDKIFVLNAKIKETLFISGNPDVQPHTLLAQIFDSIQIRPVSQGEVSLRFSPERAMGYPKNIFKDSTAWGYEFRSFPINLMFSKVDMKSHEFTFDFAKQVD